MKTFEWLILAGGIVLVGAIVLGAFRFGNTTKTTPQFAYPNPKQPNVLHGVHAQQIDYVPPQFSYTDPKHPNILHGVPMVNV